MARKFWLSIMVSGVVAGILSPLPALAMGYDSLACPELAERRIEFFTSNGFCNPAKADAKDCKPIVKDAEADLPEAARTQVTLIVRTELRKECPAK
jgi:hypothetical protein